MSPPIHNSSVPLGHNNTVPVLLLVRVALVCGTTVPVLLLISSTRVLCQCYSIYVQIMDHKLLIQKRHSCVVRNEPFLCRLKSGQIPKSVKLHLTLLLLDVAPLCQCYLTQCYITVVMLHTDISHK